MRTAFAVALGAEVAFFVAVASAAAAAVAIAVAVAFAVPIAVDIVVVVGVLCCRWCSVKTHSQHTQYLIWNERPTAHTLSHACASDQIMNDL